MKFEFKKKTSNSTFVPTLCVRFFLKKNIHFSNNFRANKQTCYINKNGEIE